MKCRITSLWIMVLFVFFVSGCNSGAANAKTQKVRILPVANGDPKDTNIHNDVLATLNQELAKLNNVQIVNERENADVVLSITTSPMYNMERNLGGVFAAIASSFVDFRNKRTFTTVAFWRLDDKKEIIKDSVHVNLLQFLNSKE